MDVCTHRCVFAANLILRYAWPTDSTTQNHCISRLRCPVAEAQPAQQGVQTETREQSPALASHSTSFSPMKAGTPTTPLSSCNREPRMNQSAGKSIMQPRTNLRRRARSCLTTRKARPPGVDSMIVPERARISARRFMPAWSPRRSAVLFIMPSQNRHQ